MAALFAMIVIAPHLTSKAAVAMNAVFWTLAVALAIAERTA